MKEFYPALVEILRSHPSQRTKVPIPSGFIITYI